MTKSKENHHSHPALNLSEMNSSPRLSRSHTLSQQINVTSTDKSDRNCHDKTIKGAADVCSSSVRKGL
jgi:hypothetical protein